MESNLSDDDLFDEQSVGQDVSPLLATIEAKLQKNLKDQVKAVQRLETLKSEEQELRAAKKVLDELFNPSRKSKLNAQDQQQGPMIRGEQERQVVELLLANSFPMDTRQITNALGKPDSEVPNMSSNLSRMAHKGIILQLKEGRRALWWVNRDEDDDLPF
jgi:hypothetical protein